jgi:NADH:ubiquinone oxidoreductase subunit 5 (subunit L)/multisubunit Na+/H+ antiporter MnhA subunit
MEARTRISALIHAATMVTAGIYVIIRSNMMINGTKIEIILIVLGSITAIMGGIMGIYKNDIKKIIAYSTISQLGYMIIGTGIGKYSLSIYHLINHAFIKALLFLGSGSIIHASLDNQDIRRKGGLFKRIPETIILMIIGSLSIMGIPNLTGYESKDTIIEVIGGTYKIKGIWIITIIGCGITGIYSIKILKGLMEKVNNGSSKKRIYESSYHILIRLYILGILSIIGGYLLKDL